MSRKYQIDQALLSNLPPTPNTGLLLGLPPTTATAAQILSAVATPPCPARTHQSTWAMQHALQLQPMLPPPVRVLGVYTTLNNSDAVSVCTQVASHLEQYSDAICMYPASSRRYALKQFTGSSSRSADLRSQIGLAQRLCIVRCVLSVSAMLAGGDPASVPLDCADMLQKMLSQSTLRFDPYSCVVSESDQGLLKDVLDEQSEIVANGSTEPPPTCTMHLPFGLPLHLDQPDSANVVQLTGIMQLVTLLPHDATLGHTLSALRKDADASFRARLAILQELDADRDADEEAIIANTSCALPVRVVATPTDDSTRGECIPLTDYMTNTENIPDVTNRFVELMSWDDAHLAAHSIQQVERFGNITALATPSASTRSAPTHVAKLNAALTTPVDFVKRALLIAILVAVIAVTFKLAS